MMDAIARMVDFEFDCRIARPDGTAGEMTQLMGRAGRRGGQSQPADLMNEVHFAFGPFEALRAAAAANDLVALERAAHR